MPSLSPSRCSSSVAVARSCCRRERDAGTSERIKRYDVDITIEPTGALLVRETIDYDFGAIPHHGIFRDIPVRVDYPPEGEPRSCLPDRRDVGDGVGGNAGATTASTSEGDNERIKIGDPDRTITGRAHLRDHVPRPRRAERVRRPRRAGVERDRRRSGRCRSRRERRGPRARGRSPRSTAGRARSGPTRRARPATATGDDATFTAKEIVPGLGPRPVRGHDGDGRDPEGRGARSPKPILEERFTVASAFRVTPATGRLAGGMLIFLVAIVLGAGVVLRPRPPLPGIVRRRGVRRRRAERDRRSGCRSRGEHETPVEFVPPDGLRPGQVGTLVDFKANPLDVTATIVDLAVRGYLKIEELSDGGLFRSRTGSSRGSKERRRRCSRTSRSCSTGCSRAATR